MSIEIIQAKNEHYQTIKELMLEALQADPTAFTVSFTEYAKNSDIWWLRYLEPYLSGQISKMFLAKDTGNNKFIAMAGCMFNTRERTSHVATIVWVYVNKNYRGQKIATHLMEKIMESIQKFGGILKVNLTVSSGQQIAINMYSKQGFKTAGTQQNELKIDGQFYDFHIMEKFL